MKSIWENNTFPLYFLPYSLWLSAHQIEPLNEFIFDPSKEPSSHQICSFSSTNKRQMFLPQGEAIDFTGVWVVGIPWCEMCLITLLHSLASWWVVSLEVAVPTLCQPLVMQRGIKPLLDLEELWVRHRRHTWKQPCVIKSGKYVRDR